jgi:hypothetical protein
MREDKAHGKNIPLELGNANEIDGTSFYRCA